MRRRSNAYSVPPVTPEAAASSLAVTPGRWRTTASTASRLAPRRARARTGLTVPRPRGADFATPRAFAVDADAVFRPRPARADFREPVAPGRAVRGGRVAEAVA